MNLSPQELAARRIAYARAAAAKADNQGQPVGPPRTFHYDEDSRLIDVDVPEEP